MTNKTYTAQEMRNAVLKMKSFQGNRPTAIRIEGALLYAAAMVERCDKAVESMHTQLMHLANEGKTTVDIGRLSKYFAHLENILRGDAEDAS